MWIEKIYISRRVFWLLFVPVYTTFLALCGVYAEVFFQNQPGLTGLVTVPFDHIPGGPPPVHHWRDVVNPIQIDIPMNYIFLYDCSGSVGDDQAIPPWYERRLDELRKASYPLTFPRNESIPDAIKVKLYHLLSHLKDRNVGKAIEDKDSFAVWAVCDSGEMLYPETVQGEMIKVETEYVRAAIAKMENRNEAGADTVFREAFEKLDGTYDFGAYNSPFDRPKFLIIIISDFINDPRGDVDHDNQDREAVERIAARILHGKVQVTTIRVSTDETDSRSIFPYIQSSIQPYRLKVHEFEIDTNFDKAGSVLSPLLISQEPLKFQHNGEPGNVHATISIDFGNTEEISVGLKPVFGENVPLDFGLDFAVDQYEVDSEKFEPLRMTRDKNIKIDDYERLFLRFRGVSAVQGLRLMISADSGRNNILVPIIFRNRLPGDVAVFMFVLQVVSFVLILLRLPLLLRGE